MSAWVCVFLLSPTLYHISCRASQALDSSVWHSWTKSLFVCKRCHNSFPTFNPTPHPPPPSTESSAPVVFLWRQSVALETHTHTHISAMARTEQGCGIYLTQARCLRNVWVQAIDTHIHLHTLQDFAVSFLLSIFFQYLKKSCVLTRAFKKWSISHITGSISRLDGQLWMFQIWQEFPSGAFQTCNFWLTCVLMVMGRFQLRTDWQESLSGSFHHGMNTWQTWAQFKGWIRGEGGIDERKHRCPEQGRMDESVWGGMIEGQERKSKG